MQKGGRVMSRSSSPRRGSRRRHKMSLWHRFVLLVGYMTLLYAAAQGVIYLLVLLGGPQ